MTRLRRLDLPLCTKWWVRRSKVLIQTLCSSYYHGQGQGQAARWKLQVVDPQDLFNRLISLALVLTSGGGDGLPISLTKIMGYELSQFPASLFETEYLMLATNKPQIIQMLIKAFYKLEGADRVVQKMKFRVIKKSELTTL